MSKSLYYPRVQLISIVALVVLNAVTSIYITKRYGLVWNRREIINSRYRDAK